MAQYYYNGAFTGALQNRFTAEEIDVLVRAVKERDCDIGDGTNTLKLASVKHAYNKLGKCVSFMPIFPIVMDTTMISLVFKYFSLQIMYHFQIVKCICEMRESSTVYACCSHSVLWSSMRA